MAQVGVEPTASLVLSQGGLPVAYRAVVPRAGVEPANTRRPPLCGGARAEPLCLVGVPGREWSWADSNRQSSPCRGAAFAAGLQDRVLEVESPGVAPGSPACNAGVVLLDHDPNVFSAESVGLEPTSGKRAAACFPSKFLNHSDGFRYYDREGGSRGTRTHKRLFAATCFQDRALIQPVGFRMSQAAEAGIEPA